VGCQKEYQAYTKCYMVGVAAVASLPWFLTDWVAVCRAS